MTDEKNNAWRFNEIPESKVSRISTGFQWLDRIFGGDSDGGYGLPLTKQSVWSGTKGVGKTRLLMEIACRVNQLGRRLLFVENEVPASALREMVKGSVPNPNLFLVSKDGHDTQRIIGDIMQERPELVIIDSFSMLHGVKVESVVENMLSKFREVAQVTGCHQIFIMQQNKLGDTKGSSSIGHLVDIEVFLDKKVVPTVRELAQKISMEHDGLPVTSRLRAIAKGRQNVLAPQFRGCFQVEVRKNRCGPSNNYVVFKHVDNGVEFVFSNLLKAE